MQLIEIVPVDSSRNCSESSDDTKFSPCCVKVLCSLCFVHGYVTRLGVYKRIYFDMCALEKSVLISVWYCSICSSLISRDYRIMWLTDVVI